MKVQLGYTAAICLAVMLFAYMTDFYPLFTAIGCVGAMVFVAFRDNSLKSMRKPDAKLMLPPEEPPYVN
jgi:hypothetical protein